jgi:hypothetical protein
LGDPSGDEPRRKGRLAYFNTAAAFIARLDQAGLQESKCTEIRNAIEAAFRAPGITVHVAEVGLDSSQLLALGFNTLAQRIGPEFV